MGASIGARVRRKNARKVNLSEQCCKHESICGQRWKTAQRAKRLRISFLRDEVHAVREQNKRLKRNLSQLREKLSRYDVEHVTKNIRLLKLTMRLNSLILTSTWRQCNLEKSMLIVLQIVQTFGWLTCTNHSNVRLCIWCTWKGMISTSCGLLFDPFSKD